jgi:hypothetical protein
MEEKKFFDFKSGEEFNLNEEYSKFFGEGDTKFENPAESKLRDAEKVIGEIGAKYIESFSLQKYERSFLNLSEFLSKFRTDSVEVKNMTKDDRDKLWAYGKELYTYYQDRYNNLDFNFEVSVKEWNFIDHTLSRKLSYNGQEVFNYWELYIKFIEPTRVIASSVIKQKIESFTPICSLQSLVLLGHFLMTNEEKANSESFYLFRNVLAEIGQMNKLFNAYSVILERVSNSFNNWVNALNAMDGYNNDNREVVEPNYDVDVPVK